MSYDINSNILETSGVNASQLGAAINAIRSDNGFTGAQQFLDAEHKYGINALFIAAHAAIESAWGTSYYAKTRNNLYGFNAVDSDPNEASTYPSQDASTDFYGNFLKTYYLTPGAVYYNGTTPHGVFVKYSSSHDAEAQSVVGIMNLLNSHITGAPAPAPTQPPQGPPINPVGTSSNHYVVQRNDNLSNIAAQHGVSLAQLEAWNPGAGHPAGNFNVIWPGDVLNLGGATPPPPAAPAETNYLIKSGDVLSVVAPRFGTTVNQIVEWNKGKYPSITPDYIQAGWVIRVS